MNKPKRTVVLARDCFRISMDSYFDYILYQLGFNPSQISKLDTIVLSVSDFTIPGHPVNLPDED